MRKVFAMLHLRWHAAGRIALVLLVAGGIGAMGSARPSLAQGDDDAWVPLTIVYTSDIKGKIEPCG
jgi:hypothetical protein